MHLILSRNSTSTISTMTFPFHFSLLVFAIFLAVVNSQADYKPKTNKNVAMFVFGDSLFDPGNNNYLYISITGKANFPPYGETYFHYPTGRHCDGRILPDFVASKLGLPYCQPYLDPNNTDYTVGANFASAGSGVTLQTDDAVNLNTQMEYMNDVVSVLKQQLGEEEANELLQEAIYYSSLGGVDYVVFVVTNSDPTQSEIEYYVDEVIGNITTAIKEIYELGGRKFLFQNISPMGCNPGSKLTYNTSGCSALLETVISTHNSALNALAENLANTLPGFKYLVFDFFTEIYNRIADPLAYGFEVGNMACCGSGAYRGTADCGWLTEEYELCSDPNEYVYWDSGHPTEAVNRQLIELLWNGTTNVTWPINLRQLVELEVNSSEVLIQENISTAQGFSKTY